MLLKKNICKTTAQCLVNNTYLTKTISKKEKRAHKANKETNYSKDQSLWIARSKWNLKDGKSVWNNIGKKEGPLIFPLVVSIKHVISYQEDGDVLHTNTRTYNLCLLDTWMFWMI